MNSVFGFFIFLISVSLPPIFSLNSDGEALLSLINKLVVPTSIKSSWNLTTTHQCDWLGIECNRRGFVTSLDLSGYGVSGKLGDEIGSLKYLSTIDLSDNVFFGEIPKELGSCSELQNLDLSLNILTGKLPLTLGNLKKLSKFSVYNNSLSGEIPAFLFQNRLLYSVDLGMNYFTGPIPSSVGNATELTILVLSENQLSGMIPNSIGDCAKLKELDLNSNNLVGNLPSCLINLEFLSYVDVGKNSLEGWIPFGFDRCENLIQLNLYGNFFTGEIPVGLGNCSSLTTFDAKNNSLTGHIPSTFGLLSKLIYLYLSDNHLSGKIPLELGNLVKLERLGLSHNNLQGHLPPQISKCKMLYLLDVGSNSLNGSIPSSFKNLKQLSILKLEENKFTGGIPDFLPELVKLLELQLGDNLLGGYIPPSVGELHLYDLNLSGNGLTGEIPLEFEKFSLLHKLDISRNNLTGTLLPLRELYSLIELNVSYNHFIGSIPKTLRKLPSFTLSSFLGNLDLCVTCQLEEESSNQRGPNITLVIVILGSSFFCGLMILLAGFILVRCRKVETGAEIFQDSPLLNQVLAATENLNARFIIGRGAHGTVYKASLDSGRLYAVKKLDFVVQGASESMDTEINTVGKIRHRNIVRLEDFGMREDYGLILYNYIENGSLHDVLHGISPPLDLNWELRYMIALRTARALSYLHDDCIPAIVHRDIKLKNILLDSDMEPHISDFGIAQLVDESSPSATISFMGTFGYIPPEVANTTTTTTSRIKKWDVYSFGVVLLELITRKKAVDPSFQEGIDIVRWVHSIEAIEDIVDQSLVGEFMGTSVKQEVTRVMLVALRCTSNDPDNRPTIKDVVKLLTCAKTQRMFLDYAETPSSLVSCSQLQQISSNISVTNPSISERTYWKTPPSGWIKINVDGAWSLGNAAAGAIARSHDGSFIGCISNYCDASSSIEAKAHAFLLGIDLLSQLNLRNVILEGDAKTVVDLINDPSTQDIWRVRPAITQCRSFLANRPDVICSFSPRQTNEVAHRLASSTFTFGVTELWSGGLPPPFLLDQLFSDLAIWDD